ncbi:MAG: DNA repair protein RecN [Betaproteobacteria bacterium]|nr:DNA repair protein RecN [Betaproteobacteria bacterium]
MLRFLSLRDFVIVDALDLEFRAGFTALTGETGAGKSILIDALSLALGARNDAIVVRPGAARAEISADFDAASRADVTAWLEENAFADDGACLLRRVIDDGNRSRAFINGRPATLTQLRDLGGLLLDIHGQHEHQRLLSRDAQLALLDDYAGTQERVKQTAAAWRAWQAAADARAAREANDARSAREREELAWQLNELSALGFNPAAWEDLQAEHARLANAATLIESAQRALDAIDGDAALASQADEVLGGLKRATDTDPALKPALELVESAGVHLAEAAHHLRQYLARLEVDPKRLEEVDGQLAAVHGAARKYRVEPTGIPALIEDKQARFNALGGDSSLEDLKAREAAAEREYSQVAEKLSRERAAAAKRFGAEVTATMQTLAMEGGRFEVGLTTCPPSAHGNEHCEYSVAAHAGQAAGPLARVASGGELSRISLAIQMLASTRAGVPTLIFDEVDAGIGGRVAEIVGKLLAELASRHQVLCVTHLPQVAACADQQYRVVKETRGQSAASRIEILDGGERIEEIARMLGGIHITAATRQHAAEMLGNARRTTAAATAAPRNLPPPSARTRKEKVGERAG